MKIGRRELLSLLPVGLALLTPVALSQNTQLKGRVSNDKQPSSLLEDRCGISENDTSQVKIAKYNQYLEENPAFDWAVHNELRHLYGCIGDEKSATGHSDIILKNALSDNYILNILSGWQLGHDNQKAISNLLYYTKAYPKFKYVEAACLVQIADLYGEIGNKKSAREFYRRVIKARDRNVQRYSVLAEARLETLERSA